MRNTKQRELILSIVNSSYIHPNTQDIYLRCREVLPNISLGTVYRNLNSLVGQGLIKRIKMTNNIDRYDRMDEHAHFICNHCHKIIDLEDDYLLQTKEIGKNKVMNYELNFRGICEDCQKEE